MRPASGKYESPLVMFQPFSFHLQEIRNRRETGEHGNCLKYPSRPPARFECAWEPRIVERGGAARRAYTTPQQGMRTRARLCRSTMRETSDKHPKHILKCVENMWALGLRCRAHTAKTMESERVCRHVMENTRQISSLSRSENAPGE